MEPPRAATLRVHFASPEELLSEASSTAAKEGLAVSKDHVNAVQSALMRVSPAIRQGFPAESSFCFSPVSIACIFGMLLRGLEVKGQEALLTCCKLQEFSPKLVLQALSQITGALSSETPGSAVMLANAIALHPRVMPDYSYLSDFLSNLQGIAFGLDQGVTERINEWFCSKTEGRIERLVSERALEHVYCAPLNACAIDAKWQKQFTTQILDTFTDGQGRCSTVCMLTGKLRANAFEGVDCTLVEIPCSSAASGQRCSFIILLPERDVPLTKFMQGMTPEKLASMQSRAREEEVQLTIPKLRIRYKMDSLKAILKEAAWPVDEPLSSLSPRLLMSKIISEVILETDDANFYRSKATRASTPDAAGIRVDRPFAFYFVKDDAVICEGNVQDETFLVTEEECQKDFVNSLKPIQHILNDKEAASFFALDKDIRLIMRLMQDQIAKPQVRRLSFRGSCFTIVNYTDVDVRLNHDPARNKKRPFYFTLNGQTCSGGFSRKPCQVVFCPSSKLGFVCSYSKVEGRQTILHREWDLETGSYTETRYMKGAVKGDA